MYAHVAEVVTKTRLHKSACCRIEWLTRRIQHLIDDRRNCVRARTLWFVGLSLQVVALLLTLSTFAATLCLAAARTLTLQHRTGNRIDGCAARVISFGRT